MLIYYLKAKKKLIGVLVIQIKMLIGKNVYAKANFNIYNIVVLDISTSINVGNIDAINRKINNNLRNIDIQANANKADIDDISAINEENNNNTKNTNIQADVNK